MTAKYTDVFTNASLGWPAGFSLNLPSGGPSPPPRGLAALYKPPLRHAAIFEFVNGMPLCDFLINQFANGDA
jgi:hypothetical protein